MLIRLDDVRSPQMERLIRAHLQNMTLHSPPESIHALGLEALRKPDITMWSAWEADELLGCGALKQLDAAHGEVKSMRTATPHLRKGVAARILETILGEANARHYRRLSLETGSGEAFAPARSLYARFGFTVCGPFQGYVEDPHSTFMTKLL